MGVQVLHGDCRPLLRDMDAETFHSCVTDPPYHLTSIVKRFGAENAAPVKPGVYARSAAGFMGKTWDGGDVAFRPETWAEVLRVMKPGAHLVAFGGSRTWHRLACAIEDAGFEIRDSLMFLYGSGFPKSHNINKAIGIDNTCQCHKTKSQWANEEGAVQAAPVPTLRKHVAAQDQARSQAKDLFGGLCGGPAIGSAGREDASDGGAARHGGNHLPNVRHDDLEAESLGEESVAIILQPVMPGKGSDPSSGAQRERPREEAAWEGHEGSTQPRMEGRRDVSQSARELCERPVCAVSDRVPDDGAQGRVCDGASSGNGAMGREGTDADGVRASRRSRSAAQRPAEPGIVAGQSQSQTGGAWVLCDRCGKPRIPDGIGTALKPAFEPIILARKPLAGTNAQNVLAHGCGGLHVDACRVETDENLNGGAYAKDGGRGNLQGDEREGAAAGMFQPGKTAEREYEQPAGRWPPNLLYDGSDEVLAAFGVFGEKTSGTGAVKRATAAGHQANAYGKESRPEGTPMHCIGDSGSAARFFPALPFTQDELRFHYSGKATADDRAGSKHPTIKPLALMKWLCTLITPPGGHILDPFAGSGTTGEAARLLGFDCTLIEQDASHVADIKRRLGRAAGNDTPLFAEVQ
jgi:DNA modification methylase